MLEHGPLLASESREARRACAKQALWSLWQVGPLVIASLQSLLWTHFSLHGALLKVALLQPALCKLFSPIHTAECKLSSMLLAP